VIVVIGICILIAHLLAEKFTPYTKNGRVEAFVVPIVPLISGSLTKINVTNNQIVANSQVLAVIIFFSLNLSQHALAMIYICFMAGTPNKNNSIVAMKANATATCIGGVAIIIAFNLLVAVPTYLFLIVLTLFFALLFSNKIYGGSVHTAAWSSGFTTFLVLLGSSTGVDKTASVNFYLRIAQVLFAGLFTVGALVIIERISRPGKFLSKRNSI